MRERKNVRCMLFPYCLFLLAWGFWALWLRRGWNDWAALGIKTLVFGIIPLIVMLLQQKHSGENWLVQPRELLSSPFPGLACVAALCLSAAFLYTLRILRGLSDTFVIFAWDPIIASVWAGVVEEFFFRAYLFGKTAPGLGFFPAALLNGAAFVIYHYPEFLWGEGYTQLLSFRAGLIFVMGVLFCAMLQKWRCIGLNMVVHTGWNILSYFFCVG